MLFDKTGQTGRLRESAIPTKFGFTSHIQKASILKATDPQTCNVDIELKCHHVIDLIHIS